MLSSKNPATNLRSVAFLIVFSFIFSYSASSEDIKKITAEDYRAKGLEAQRKGDFQGALAAYTKALAVGGVEDAALMNDMGVMAEQSGFPQRAEQYYRRAIELDEDYLPAYTNLAYLYKSQDDKEKAFEFFKKRYELAGSDDPWAEKAKEEMVALYPASIKWIVVREGEKMNRDLTAEAERQFTENVQYAQEHCHRARDYFSEERFEDALREYQTALERTPDFPEALKGIEETQTAIRTRFVDGQKEKVMRMMNQGDFESAQKEIQRVLASEPNG